MENESEIENIWKDFFTDIGVGIQESKNESKKCQNCNNEFFTIINGDLLCNCGFVIESRVILDDAEWNNYSEEGVMNSSGIRAGNVIDPTNPFDHGEHFLPKYHWSKMYKTDIGLINVLSVLGWFYHSLWVVAVILAFINWKVLESIVIGVIQKALGIIPNLPQPQISQEENTDNYDNILENKNSNNLNTFKDNEITFIKDNNKK
jgi:transcription initiation factor TFIIIB Brf1 subunit/transcription initiation factor TFIIB